MATLIDNQRPQTAAGPASAMLAPEVDSHDLLRILWRHKWIVFGTLALVMGLIGLYLLRSTPLYTSTATIEVITQMAEPTGAADQPRALTPQDEIRILTHLELLKSPSLGRNVVQDLDLDQDPEFVSKEMMASLPDNPQEAEAIRIGSVTDALYDKVDISRIGQSALIKISVSTTNPEKSALIANTVAGTHRKNLLRERRQSTKRQIESLTARAGELRAEAIDGERAAVEQSKAAGMTGQLATSFVGSADRLAAQLSEAKAQRAVAETRFNQLGRIGGGMSGSASAVSPLLTDLRGQQAALDKKIAELSAQYGPGHPDLRTTIAQREELAIRLGEEMARVRQEASAEVAAARARESQLSSDYAVARGRELRATDASVGVSDLQHSAATNRELYLAQLARLQELRGREQALRAEASIVAKALIPIEPSSPQATRLLVAGLCGGLILGILLAFAVEVLDRRIRTSQQIRRLLGLETLAMVPELEGPEEDFDPVRMLKNEPTSVFAESVRSLCLDIMPQVRGLGRTVAITSPLPREGKTVLSVSLAACAALIGRKVVIVDLDLRRPAVCSMLKMESGKPDLVDCLGREGVLDTEMVTSALQPHPTLDKLYVLAANQVPKDPGALLLSDRLDDLLRILRRQFDLIIFNSPPILPVRDAKQLAALANVTLLVLRWGRSTPDAARAAQQVLGRHVTGVVLNRVDVKSHARKLYGDRLQHYSAYSSYFSPAPEGN